MRWFARVGSLAAALALVACGGGGGGGTVQTGTLQMSMTDAPSCYQSVIVKVSKVRVHMSDDTAKRPKFSCPELNRAMMKLRRVDDWRNLGYLLVDYATLERIPKLSAHWFSQLCATRTIPVQSQVVV